MAKYSSPKTPQDLKLDIDDAVALTAGERAAGRIVRGAHLTEQLEVGRALVVLQRIADGMGGRGGSNYPVAMNAQLEAYPKLAAISPQLRAAAIWCILNWNDGVKAYLDGDITEHQRQTMGVPGLKAAVEVPRSEVWRNAERPPRERPYNYGEGAWRAMGKHGLTFDRDSETFVVADEEKFIAWTRHVLGKSIFRDTGVNPDDDATLPTAPSAPGDDDAGDDGAGGGDGPF
jgi:hypothetical protein